VNYPVLSPPYTPDPEEAVWQSLRDECEDEFIEWQRADYDRREFEDFGNWVVNKARWNRPNKYEEALTYDERRDAFLTDERLLALSKGQKAFARGGVR